MPSRAATLAAGPLLLAGPLATLEHHPHARWPSSLGYLTTSGMIHPLQGTGAAKIPGDGPGLLLAFTRILRDPEDLTPRPRPPSLHAVQRWLGMFARYSTQARFTHG